MARVSLVNYYGAVQLDEFVRQRERVVDYRTQWNGVRETDMIKGPLSQIVSLCPIIDYLRQLNPVWRGSKAGSWYIEGSNTGWPCCTQRSQGACADMTQDLSCG